MNRRFAIIQALVSLVALAAVVWWASRRTRPTSPPTGVDCVARWRRSACTPSRRSFAASAGTGSSSSRGCTRDAPTSTRSRASATWATTFSRPRGRGAARRAALAALRWEQAHAARVGRGRAHARPARARHDLRRHGLRRAEHLGGAAHRPSAGGDRRRRGARARCRGGDLGPACAPCLRSRARLVAPAGRRAAGDPRAGTVLLLLARDVRAVGARGDRVPGRGPRARHRLRLQRRALPRGAHELRRGAARRARVDRDVRRGGRVRRQGARRHRLRRCLVRDPAALRPLRPITVFGLVMLVTRYGGWSRLRSAASLEASRA